MSRKYSKTKACVKNVDRESTKNYNIEANSRYKDRIQKHFVAIFITINAWKTNAIENEKEQ